MTRCSLLATAALFAWNAPASAQWIVNDPINTVNTGLSVVEAVKSTANQVRSLANEGTMIVNQSQQIMRAVETVNSIRHGNVFGVLGLIPELAELGVVNPLDADVREISDAMAGVASAAGAVGQLTRRTQATTQIYAPGARDFHAVSLNANASAAAANLALATRSLESSNRRLAYLPALGRAVSTTADIKDSMDANVRVGMEQTTQTAQLVQQVALGNAQAARREVREAQREQAWRASADQLVADATASAQAAGGGQVQMIVGTGISPAVLRAGPVSDGVGMSDPALAATPVAAPGGSSALARMMAQPWGAEAAQGAERIGVNPSAVAGNIQVESDFRNVPAREGGTIRGVAQMTNGTFQAAARQAGISADLDGQMNPAVQSVASAQELKNAAQQLQRVGIQNPTLLQSRAAYNFGAAYGPALAQAPDSASMSSILNTYSADTLAKSGVTPGMTVGAWRANLARKLGDSANEPTLLSPDRST